MALARFEYIVIDGLLGNSLFRRFAPVVLGLLFIVLFVSLALWQLDRAAEKKELMSRFESDGGYSRSMDFASLEAYDRIEAFGQYEPERQILIDNIPLEGRIGYYVITPFRLAANDSLLLVNRGWIAKTSQDGPLPDLSVDPVTGTVHGLAGRLPRVGIRPGEAFEGQAEWPRVAVYPDLDEVATQLEEPVLPAVLLLGADEADGFVRRWQPNVSGPATHYGYAFQWFAMASAVVVLLAWYWRKGRQPA